jgi:hypothetical protein
VWEVTLLFTVSVSRAPLVDADESSDIEMKYILAAIYTNWETVIIDDEGIEQRDFYTAPPKSGRLMIRLNRVIS